MEIGCANRKLQLFLYHVLNFIMSMSKFSDNYNFYYNYNNIIPFTMCIILLSIYSSNMH